MFQILLSDRALYIKANNCVEEKEWRDLLTKICQTNRNRLNDYHPSAFTGNHWLCCRKTSELASGCCPVSRTLPVDIALHVDPDRDVARIHSLLMDKMNTINDLLQKYSTQSNILSKDEEEGGDNKFPSTASHSSSESKGTLSSLCNINHIHVEDPQTFCSTLTQLKQLVLQLDQDQKLFIKKECQETVYGSEKAPIGDTHYLSMIAKHIDTHDNNDSKSAIK